MVPCTLSFFQFVGRLMATTIAEEIKNKTKKGNLCLRIDILDWQQLPRVVKVSQHGNAFVGDHIPPP